MAVALDDATVAKLGPAAQRSIRLQDASRTAAAPTPIRARHPPEPKAEPKVSEPKATPDAKPNGEPTPRNAKPGPSPRVRAAASATRAGWRFAGSGKANTGGNPTVRGVLWLFVWIGVLFYLVANPSTLPRIIHIVFAPVNGLLAVAKGPHVAAAKTA